MTQEKQFLLLQDLCARLLYNVKCKVHLDTKGYCLRDEDKYCDDTLESVNCKKQTCTFNKSIGYNFGNFAIEEVKPYLRPMYSMTEEEKEKYHYLCYEEEREECKFGEWKSIHYHDTIDSIDFLNAHHFDYRNLIERGLAIEVTKENNPYKE